jgi:hypothetical protein
MKFKSMLFATLALALSLLMLGAGCEDSGTDDTSAEENGEGSASESPSDSESETPNDGEEADPTETTSGPVLGGDDPCIVHSDQGACEAEGCKWMYLVWFPIIEVTLKSGETAECQQRYKDIFDPQPSPENEVFEYTYYCRTPLEDENGSGDFRVVGEDACYFDAHPWPGLDPTKTTACPGLCDGMDLAE